MGVDQSCCGAGDNGGAASQIQKSKLHDSKKFVTGLTTFTEAIGLSNYTDAEMRKAVDVLGLSFGEIIEKLDKIDQSVDEDLSAFSKTLKQKLGEAQAFSEDLRLEPDYMLNDILLTNGFFRVDQQVGDDINESDYLDLTKIRCFFALFTSTESNDHERIMYLFHILSDEQNQEERDNNAGEVITNTQNVKLILKTLTLLATEFVAEQAQIMIGDEDENAQGPT